MKVSIGRILLIVASPAVFFGLGSLPAWAEPTPVTQCGQELSVPGHYYLPQDLGPCTGHGVVITGSDVTFDLAGYTISGVSSQASCNLEDPQTGVDVRSPASGVRVTGGTVTGFVEGVSLGSGSRVSAMRLVDNCEFGVVVSGTGSRVDTNIISGSDDGVLLCDAHGVVVSSNEVFGNARYGVILSCGLDGSTQNHIVRNILHDNGLPSGDGGGIAVYSGGDNRVAGNAVSGNWLGILLSYTTQTVVEDNTVNGNLTIGITLSELAHGNFLHDNSAYRNGLADLTDDNPDCDSNTWTSDRFWTDLVAGLPDGGPGAGCIQ